MHPLDGARGKLARGRHHAKYLYERDAAELEGPDPPTTAIRAHIDPSDQTLVLTIGQVAEIPEDTAFVVSEAVNSLRSALDYLITELAWIDARGNPKVADQRQSFPMAVKKDWQSPRVQKKALGGLTLRHRAIVRRFQPDRPWKRPPGAHIHPLVFLHYLSNDDKHRLLQPTQMGANKLVSRFPATGRDCRVDQARLKLFDKRTRNIDWSIRLEVGAEIERIPLIITGPEPYMPVQVEGGGYTGIGPGLSVVDHLYSSADYVEKVIQAFAAEFDRPVAKRIWHPRPGRIEGLEPPPVANPGRVRMFSGGRSLQPRT